MFFSLNNRTVWTDIDLMELFFDVSDMFLISIKPFCSTSKCCWFMSHKYAKCKFAVSLACLSFLGSFLLLCLYLFAHHFIARKHSAAQKYFNLNISESKNTLSSSQNHYCLGYVCKWELVTVLTFLQSYPQWQNPNITHINIQIILII